ITIRLGYADIILKKCPKCKGTKAYTVSEKCEHCKSTPKPLRRISFVDAPGHESLMATMLSGSAIMDAALIIISANEKCPQPQTQEHVMAMNIMGIENVIIVQNKIDVVSEKETLENYKDIKKFLKDTKYKDAPIIPISAQQGINIDFLIEAIEKYFPTPKRNDKKDPLFFVARSFDINKPGTEIKDLNGGVLGGTLKQGKLKEGDEVEIRPGRAVEQRNQIIWNPINTKIIGLASGNISAKEILPGGSSAIMTLLDPSIVKSDRLTGTVVGRSGKLPKVWMDITLEIHLLDRVVGTEKELDVKPIKMNETLMLNVNSTASVGVVYELKKGTIKCKLKLPVCVEAGSRITISRRISNRFRLIGYGILKE
ncbi:translation initiation factor IF-2 subunit gamma, partial [Candidatus Woesearchaeota archaeon]|nr:translation initiation factor IF-2 subunit gamma [Candidatus Woesearchaeota archaeon]